MRHREGDRESEGERVYHTRVSQTQGPIDVQIYSDITRFHAKYQDPPQGRGPERGMVRDRKWEKESERES